MRRGSGGFLSCRRLAAPSATGLPPSIALPGQLQVGGAYLGHGAYGAQQVRDGVDAPSLAQFEVDLCALIAVAAQGDAGASPQVAAQDAAQAAGEIGAHRVQAELQQARPAAAGVGERAGAARSQLEAAAGKIVDAQAAFDHQHGIAGEQGRDLLVQLAKEADLDGPRTVLDAYERVAVAALAHGDHHAGHAPWRVRTASEAVAVVMLLARAWWLVARSDFPQ